MSEIYPATGVATHEVPTTTSRPTVSETRWRLAPSHGGYELLVSTGAQRATQTLACFLSALGEKVPGGVELEEGLRSRVEERWKAVGRKRGTRGHAFGRSGTGRPGLRHAGCRPAPGGRSATRRCAGARRRPQPPRTRQRSSASLAPSSGRRRRATAYFSSARTRDSRSSPCSGPTFCAQAAPRGSTRSGQSGASRRSQGLMTIAAVIERLDRRVRCRLSDSATLPPLHGRRVGGLGEAAVRVRAQSDERGGKDPSRSCDRRPPPAMDTSSRTLRRCDDPAL